MARWWMCWLATACVVVSGWRTAGAQEKGDAMQPVAEVEGVSEYVLDNGARVLLYPDPSATSVTVNMTVLVGSRHEGYGEAGMAHLLEHMLFKGTPLHPDVPKALQDRGASFNGTTWLDRTNYYETLPAEGDNLEFAIRLEADRLVNSFVRGEDLQSEMTVVRNEFERGENSPQRILMQRIQAAAFEWHNYGKSTIGNRSDIERVPITNLRDFYRRHYQPDNIVVIIGGKFETKEALSLVQKYFGVLARPDRVQNTTYTEEPPQDGERTVVLRRVGDVKMVGAAYHIPAASHPEYAAVEVLATVLGMEPAGRLYKDLVETKLASSAYSFTFDTHDPGMMLLGCEAPKDTPIETVRTALIESIERVGEGVTNEEVDQAKENLLNRREQTTNDVSRTVSELSEWSARGDWRLFFLHRDRLEQVTPEDVQRAAATYLQRNNRTVGLFIPTEKAERVAVPARPNVAELVDGYQGREAVQAGEQIDTDPLKIQERTEYVELPGGITAALLAKKTRGNAVQATLNFRYGSAETLEGMHAAMSLLPDLLTRGAGAMTHDEFQRELDKYRATLSAAGNTGLVSLSINVKRENLVPVLNLARLAVREPRLSEAEFEVVKREALVGLEQQRSDPMSLAMRELQRSLAKPYPREDVRYSPTIDEEIEFYQEATIDQVRALHQMLGGVHGEIAVVGDFDPAELAAELEGALQDWSPGVEYARVPDPAYPEAAGGAKTLLTPDKANSAYMAGLSLAMKDSHPDYPALVIANYVLGGGSLSSRLGNRVRQQEGLSYTVASHLNAHPVDESLNFMVFAIANPENSAKLTQVIREELDKLVAEGITEEELERAKQGYLENAKLGRGQDRRLASLLASNLFVGRDMTFQKQMEQQIAELTVEQVNAAWRKHIDLDRLMVVTAGDFKE